MKSGALPLILGGDCSITLATVAGARRYFRPYQRDLHGSRRAICRRPRRPLRECVDGMVVSHLVGRGASELVRFWPEPPLVLRARRGAFRRRRASIPPSRRCWIAVLRCAAIWRKMCARKSAAKAASEAAIERTRGAGGKVFVLHLDVDVIAGFRRDEPAGRWRSAIGRGSARGLRGICCAEASGRDRGGGLQPAERSADGSGREDAYDRSAERKFWAVRLESRCKRRRRRWRKLQRARAPRRRKSHGNCGGGAERPRRRGVVLGHARDGSGDGSAAIRAARIEGDG